MLPPGVSAVAVTGDPPEARLLPEEEPAVAGAIAKRRQEFTTVRWCARRAMARLGLDPVPLPPGHRGAPRWPAGVVGSMTHCDGYRAAAVARARNIAALGIDAEPNGPLPDGVLEVVTTGGERRELRSLPAPSGPDAPHWDRLVFSAKESVYKTWFPLTRRWLDFEAAEITIDPAGGTFLARLLVPGPLIGGTTVTAFPGRWLVGRGLVVTAIGLPGPHPHHDHPE
ncbi:MAG: 4'-phosphopantetheinyl transferase superfamily protein [Dactylosporangium sp.]|nr:4'-phosphopantetheinyl transferase superfamily protein [Dactylosporangium sp.]